MNQTIQSKIKDKIQEDISPTRNLSGIHLKIVFGIAILWTLFQLWYASPFPFWFNFGMFKGLPARAIHLGFALTLTFLIFPMVRGKKISAFDILISIVAAFCCLYIYFFYDDLVNRGGILLVKEIFGYKVPLELIIGAIGILILLEATRRAIGLPLVIIAICFLLFSYFGKYAPDIISHGGLSVKRLVGFQWFDQEAIFGIPIGVSVDFIFLFVLFGALLETAGGGALDQNIGEFLNAIGLPTLQGYGLTEASPVVSCNLPDLVKVESVGPPFRTNKVKIADDGEILVKGENVMLGYWNLKEETEKVIKDGWLHTGDIGELDHNNYLKITDRKKDIIVNLGGDNISPSKIENILCLDEFIKQSFVYGDKKNYLVAILVTEKEINKEKIKLIIENINKSLTLIEKIKKFVLIHEEFTIENGMLTPTLKLKRKEIIKNYKQQLENLY